MPGYINPNVPDLTYEPGQGRDLSSPIPLQVDKEGRFGFVMPLARNYLGEPYYPTTLCVKMYGTLWKKVTLLGGTENDHNLQNWNGTQTNLNQILDLRYGDVNEDNQIIQNDTLNGWDRGHLNARTGGVVSLIPFEENTIYKYDYVCDLNRDNTVDGMVAGDGLLFINSLEPASDLTGAGLVP